MSDPRQAAYAEARRAWGEMIRRVIEARLAKMQESPDGP